MSQESKDEAAAEVRLQERLWKELCEAFDAASNSPADPVAQKAFRHKFKEARDAATPNA